MDYLRVGTDYYKIIEQPLLSGDSMMTICKWNKSEIITDYGKDFLKDIPKYDGFTVIPSHTKHQQVIKKFYNKYHKLEHILTEGKFLKTTEFLKHIFKEQYILGLDYLTLLWKNPTQILPILCLVSEERKTGKTTFLNWLKLIFQKNMTINKNEDFRSKFNGDWAMKLIISVDEVLLDKREDSERIKNLSTATTFKTEYKGKDKTETPFFGKFILCSNNETNFIQIDEKEIRYWVIKIPSIQDSNENTELLSELENEIPHFLYFINNRNVATPKKSRMWFAKNDIHTEALNKLVFGNKTYLDKEITEILREDFYKFEKEKLKYSLSDLVEKLRESNIRVSTTKVSEILKKNFKLESINSSYKKYYLSISPSKDVGFIVDESSHKGRHFVFLKKDFLEN